MGFKVVTLLVLVLGALVSAREDCAYALSNRELQPKDAAADHAAIAKYEAAPAQSSKASTVIQGSLEAQLVLQHVGWLASRPSKEHAKPSTRALMEEVGAGAGAGGLQHLELPPHDTELVLATPMEAKHASNGPRTHHSVPDHCQ